MAAAPAAKLLAIRAEIPRVRPLVVFEAMYRAGAGCARSRAGSGSGATWRTWAGLDHG